MQTLPDIEIEQIVEHAKERHLDASLQGGMLKVSRDSICATFQGSESEAYEAFTEWVGDTFECRVIPATRDDNFNWYELIEVTR